MLLIFDDGLGDPSASTATAHAWIGKMPTPHFWRVPMPNLRLNGLLAVCMIACLTGCNRSEAPAAGGVAPPSTADASPAEPAASAEPELLIPGLVTVEPAELDVCGKPQVVSVRWDASQVKPELVLVEIWTGPATNESVFASGPKIGKATSGLWAMPGTIFTLKEKSTGKVLSRTTIGGPACS